MERAEKEKYSFDLDEFDDLGFKLKYAGKVKAAIAVKKSDWVLNNFIPYSPY